MTNKKDPLERIGFGLLLFMLLEMAAVRAYAMTVLGAESLSTAPEWIYVAAWAPAWIIGGSICLLAAVLALQELIGGINDLRHPP